MPLSRKTRSQIRQTHLNFSPLPSSSPSRAEYPSAINDRLANVRYKGSRARLHSDSVESQTESLLTPDPSSQVEGGEPDLPPTSTTSKSPIFSADHAPSSLSPITIEHDLPLPSSKRRKLVRGGQVKQAETPTRHSRHLRSESTESQARSSPLFQSFTEQASSGILGEIGEAETTGDEDVPLSTAPARKRTQPGVHTDVVISDNSDEDIFAPTSTRRQRKAKARDDFVVDDDIVELLTSEEDAPAPGSQRPRKLKRPKTPKRSQQEQEEIDDELADLQDSDTPQKQSRTRGGPVTTQRDKNRQYFELLKRRRAGEMVSQLEDSDSLEIEEEEEVHGVDLDNIVHGHSVYGISDAGSAHSSVDTDVEADLIDDPDDDFIEDDSPSRERLPHPDIPIEFTSFATAKPRELFPHIVEWLVKNKLAPAFSRHDALYQLAFDKIDNEVKGQAGSRLISSSWGEIFKYVILARPNMQVSYLPFTEDDSHTCDACNRTNHPATYDFIFSGQAYDKDSLEPIENDSEEEEESQDELAETASHDAAGHILAPVQRHFYLGKYCAANAEMGHKLVHWKHQLNHKLLTYLEEQGVLTPEAILAREKMNKKKREREAEGIVDTMRDTGVVDQLWSDFKDDLADARIGMEGYEKKGGRGRNRVGAVESAASFVY